MRQAQLKHPSRFSSEDYFIEDWSDEDEAPETISEMYLEWSDEEETDAEQIIEQAEEQEQRIQNTETTGSTDA